MLEFENIREVWEGVLALRAKEDAERTAQLASANIDDDGEATLDGEIDIVTSMRRPPSQLAENSLNYWRSVANITVRQVVEFVASPATQAHLATQLSQSTVCKVTPEEGESLFRNLV